MSLTIEYFELQNKYSQQYGDRTIVLMQKGNFYEVYGFFIEYCTSDEAKIDGTGKIWNQSMGFVFEIAHILDYEPGIMDGTKPYGIENCHMVGCPLCGFEKCRDRLMNSDYTVIRIDQDKNKNKTVKYVENTNGKKKKVERIDRHVAEICSPTMELDNISLTRATSNIASIYIEYHKGLNDKYDNFVITTGAAVVDIITGNNIVCEFYSKTEDQIHAVQELYRFLTAHSPRELIINITDMPAGLDQEPEDNSYVKYLEKILELRRFDRLNVYVNKVNAEYKKPAYQIEFLNKLYTKKDTNNPNIIQKRNEKIIQDLELDRMNYGRIAYLLLMQYCYSRNEVIITKLPKPDIQWIDENKHLILTHNAIVQLNLIPGKEVNWRTRKTKEIDSLMSVLDHTQTFLGKRNLYSLLQNPLYNPTEISTYYDMVDEMSTEINGEFLWLLLDRQLKELPDIARLQRKLEIRKINPRELSSLYHSYVKIINLYIMILGLKTPVLHKQLLSQEDVTSFNEFIARFTRILDFDALQYCKIEKSLETKESWLQFIDCPIREKCYPELDKQIKLLTESENNLQVIVDHLNKFLESTKGKLIEFKSPKKERGAKKEDVNTTKTVLVTTNAKATKLSNANVDTNLCGKLQMIQNGTGDKIITSDKISIFCNTIDNIRSYMKKQLLSIYESIIEEMASKYNFYINIANLIAKLDLVHSYAKVSYQNNYFRPEIDTSEGPSYLEALSLRHGIIEKLIDGPYITNDVYLGRGTNIGKTIGDNCKDEELLKQRSNGSVLVSLNMCGKTSLTKAIATNIIMAQIGCFTACKLKYKPYHKIITRILGNDNMFTGESSFSVEMTELRTVLRQSDQYTLVVGDEIAHGTETISAMGITVSSVLSLLKLNASFIFSTHLHNLIDFPEIKELDLSKLKICHLSVLKDCNNNLLYERKLKLGSGSTIYGVLVAETLGLPKEFIDKAYEIVNYYSNNNKNIVETKKSKYNSSVYVDSCSICGKTGKQTELHSHHAIEQKFADNKGFVNKTTKRESGEIVSLGLMRKNSRSNLVVLCEECHLNIHSNDRKIEFLPTTNGNIIKLT